MGQRVVVLRVDKLVKGDTGVAGVATDITSRLPGMFAPGSRIESVAVASLDDNSVAVVAVVDSPALP